MPPAATTVPELLDARAAEHPDHSALRVVGGGELTFRRWREEALRAAVGLAAAGVAPRDRVVLRFSNACWERYAVAFLAVQYAGGVPVPVREDLSEADAAALAALAEARTVLREGGAPALPGSADLCLDALLAAHPEPPAGPPHRVGPGDPAQVIGTSGTTGAPKGVLAAHGNLTAGLTTHPRRRAYAHSRHALHAFPIGTNAGQVMLLGALTAAPTTLSLPRFDADRFGAAVEEFGIGTAFLVPSMAIELVNAGTAGRYDLSSLRLVNSSAAALPVPVAAALAAALPGATLVNTYTGTGTVTPYLAALRAQPHAVALTSQQENFFRWMAEAPGRDAGAVTALFRVTDRLEPETLGLALTEAVRRHPALRTRFEAVGEGVVRAVLDEEPRVRITLTRAPGAGDAEVDALLLAERDRLTDLARDPMARLLVVSRSETDHVVLVAMHHMVADGWSVGVLLADLGVFYSALRRGRSAPPARSGPGYAELVDWANAHWPASRAHFGTALAGAPEAVERFADRRSVDEVLTAAHEFEVPTALAGSLRARAAELGATPFLAVAAAWTALLARRGDQPDLVVMTPVPGRPRPDAERTVGCFVQSLLLRVDASGGPGFAELVDRLRTVHSEALDHQLHPFAEFSPSVPFAAWLRYEAWAAPAQLPGLACEPWELPRGSTVPWPLPGGDRGVPELTVVEQPDGGMRCWLQYNALAFDLPVITELATEFTTALTAACG
ncbi:condensation domain-containing protein [Streptomyces sp. NPDC048383]|uniref:condensation domain-containing protein n=1 Tax=Streptomyces sp. NPDC048383 TaxID=3155386 RepID=UPI003439E8BE